MKKQLENKKIIVISLIIFLIGIIFIIFPIKVEQVSSIGYHSIAIKEMKKDDVIKGYFKPSADKISNIGLRFSTFDTINKHGKIKIVLKENDNKIIKEEIFDLSNIKDNSMVYLVFDKQKDSNKKFYTVTISFEEYYDDIRLTTWGSNGISDDNYMVLNDKKTDYTLYCTLKGYNKTYDAVLYTLIALSMCLVIYGLEGGKTNDRKNKKQ